MFPRPCREDVRVAVLIYPELPRPSTVLANPDIVERYPKDPSPAVVDAKLLERTAVERYPEVPRPVTVLANPEIVEIYPSDPRPAVVDARLL